MTSARSLSNVLGKRGRHPEGDLAGRSGTGPAASIGATDTLVATGPVIASVSRFHARSPTRRSRLSSAVAIDNPSSEQARAQARLAVRNSRSASCATTAGCSSGKKSLPPSTKRMPVDRANA